MFRVSIRAGKNVLYVTCLCLYMNVMVITDIISNILLFFDQDFVLRSIVQYFLYIILAIIMLYRILERKRSSIQNAAVVFVITFLVFLFSYLLNPGIWPIYIKAVLVFYVFVFLQAFFLGNNADFELFAREYRRYAKLAVLYAVSVIVTHNKMPHGYSMSFSYNSFYIAGFSLFYGVKKKKPFYISVFLIVTITNLFAGSRGVLFCDFVYLVLLFYLFFMGKQKKRRHVAAVAVFIAFIAMLLLASPVAAFLSQYSDSRTLSLLAQGRLSVLSGREIYYESILREIAEHPFRIRGVLSDRYFMAQVRGLALSGDFFTAYAHNIFLEMIFQFGVLIGSGMICALVFSVVRALKRAERMKKEEEGLAVFYVLAVACAIGQLLFSNSYLSSVTSGMAAAMVIAVNKKWKAYEKL